MPLQTFAQITGLPAFEPHLRSRIEGGALSYLCNAAISYRLRGMPVHIESVWALEIPRGGGDLHWCLARGEHADLIVDQSAATRFMPELFVHPTDSNDRYAITLAQAIAALQPAFPGLQSTLPMPARSISAFRKRCARRTSSTSPLCSISFSRWSMAPSRRAISRPI